jgi:hypothetical protein
MGRKDRLALHRLPYWKLVGQNVSYFQKDQRILFVHYVGRKDRLALHRLPFWKLVGQDVSSSKRPEMNTKYQMTYLIQKDHKLTQNVRYV